MNLYFFR